MRVAGILLLFVLAACSQLPSQEEDSVRMRGHVERSGQGLVFQTCSDGSPLVLQESLSPISLKELMEHLGQGESRRTFVDLVGRPQSRNLQVTRLIHAAHGETKGCDENPDFFWKAGGNEPFWSVHIEANQARVTHLSDTTREWRFPRPDAESQGYLWRYSLGEADGDPVRLELRRTGCRDSMSGHFFAYGATLRIGEAQMTGCARTGRALGTSGPGRQF